MLRSVAFDLFGSPRCVACARPGDVWCPACRDLADRPPEGSSPIPFVARVLAPWAYEGAARDLILALKLRGRRAAAGPLVRGMVAEARAAGVVAEAVCWVPGRKRDGRTRGFDHAEILARGVAAGLGLPAAPALVRARDAIDQTRLGAGDRRRNLAGAFAARPIRGVGSVVLVDDLVTTGTTASECGRALRSVRISQIDVICACRA